MSIAPFLPGLLVAAPAPAPADVGTTTGTPTGQATDTQPGAEGEVAFMDALAAALAVHPPMASVAEAPAAPEPVAPAAPTTPTPELGFVTPELGFVTAELGFVTLDPDVPTPTPTPTPTPALPHQSISPGSSAGTFATSATPAPEETAPAVPVRTTTPVDVPADLAKVPTPPSELPTTNPLPTVTSTDSVVTNPNSAVTNPKSVERVVVAQVFPEVTRLASSGNGTHRITLTLQPAQLGEVRVTLVVRDGAVRVRLSGEAGDGAVRQALATGAPELQRMLERAGASEARVLVRDVNATPLLTTPTPAPPAPPAVRNDLTQAWSGQPNQARDFGQPGQPHDSGQSGQSGQSQRDTHPGRPGHPLEQAGRHAAPADVVPTSTPTPGRLDRNL